MALGFDAVLAIMRSRSLRYLSRTNMDQTFGRGLGSWLGALAYYSVDANDTLGTLRHELQFLFAMPSQAFSFSRNILRHTWTRRVGIVAHHDIYLSHCRDSHL
jgi:hypothetical protein